MYQHLNPHVDFYSIFGLVASFSFVHGSLYAIRLMFLFMQSLGLWHRNSKIRKSSPRCRVYAATLAIHHHYYRTDKRMSLEQKERNAYERWRKEE